MLIAGLSYGFHNKHSLEDKAVDIQPTPGFPEEIMNIVIHSCYDCHSGESQNQQAKTALNFSGWNEYKTAKQVQLLTEMNEVIKEGNMPPGRYLTGNPDKKLSEEQVNLMTKWTKESADKLLEQ